MSSSSPSALLFIIFLPNRYIRSVPAKILEVKHESQPSEAHISHCGVATPEAGSDFAEMEVARRRHWKLNTVVMKAVMDACVHCGYIDATCQVFDEMSKPRGCGADGISFGIFLKGLESNKDLVSIIKIVMEMNLLLIFLETEQRILLLSMHCWLAGQSVVDFAKMVLSKIISRGEGFSWTTQVRKVEPTPFEPFPLVFLQVLMDDPVEKYMTAFNEADPYLANGL